MDQDEMRPSPAVRGALVAEERDRLSRERGERWANDNMYITWEEYVADPHVACRGCGRPLNDGRSSWPPLSQMGEEERLAHEVEEAAWRHAHGGCHASRWSVAGSLSQHCMACCPPPPLSPGQIERIAQILAGPRPSPPNLDVWQLALRCGHSIAITMHRSNDRVGMAVYDCRECGERRGIVASTRLGPADVPEHRRAEAHRANALRAAEVELGRAEARFAKAQARLDVLRKPTAP